MFKFVIPISAALVINVSGTCSSADFEQIYYGDNSDYGYYLAMDCFTNSTQPVSLTDAKSCFATYNPVSISDGCYECVIAKQAAYDNCYYVVCPANGDSSTECTTCQNTYFSTYFGDGGCMDSRAFFLARNNQTDPRYVTLPNITRTSPALPTALTAEEITSACVDTDINTFWKETKLADAMNIINCMDIKSATNDITSTDVLECYGDYSATPLSVGCRECLAYDWNVYANCVVFCSNAQNGTECTTTCPVTLQNLADNYACVGTSIDPKVLALFTASGTSSSVDTPSISITSFLSLVAIAVVVAL